MPFAPSLLLSETGKRRGGLRWRRAKAKAKKGEEKRREEKKSH